MPIFLPSFRISALQKAMMPGIMALIAISLMAGASATARQAGPEKNHAAETDDLAESDALSDLRQALYKAVNKTRAETGARSLERDVGFEAIARDHAHDMVDRKYMSHVSPDGKNPRDRMLARFPDFTGVAGENIAMRSIRKGESTKDTAFAAVEAWLGSPPHRKNMLSQRHGFAGIAAADNGRALYIVMVLTSEPSLRPPEPEPANGSETGS